MAVSVPGLVTCNTDAGFYQGSGLSSYAYWIRFNGQLFTGSGILKERQKGATYAEEKSILNALYIIQKHIPSGVLKILFNTDCMEVIKPYTVHGRSVREELKLAHEKYIVSVGLSVQFEKFFEFRHVKAHTGADNKKSWVNNRLDELCAMELKEANHKIILADRKRRQQEGYKLKKKRRWN